MSTFKFASSFTQIFIWKAQVCKRLPVYNLSPRWVPIIKQTSWGVKISLNLMSSFIVTPLTWLNMCWLWQILKKVFLKKCRFYSKMQNYFVYYFVRRVQVSFQIIDTNWFAINITICLHLSDLHTFVYFDLQH